jgi:hypothetical protein
MTGACTVLFSCSRSVPRVVKSACTYTHWPARVLEHQKLRALSSADVHTEWHEDICALLGYYAALNGSSVPTFRDSLSVPSSRVKKSQSGTTFPRLDLNVAFTRQWEHSWKPDRAVTFALWWRHEQNDDFLPSAASQSPCCVTRRWQFVVCRLRCLLQTYVLGCAMYTRHLRYGSNSDEWGR